MALQGGEVCGSMLWFKLGCTGLHTQHFAVKTSEVYSLQICYLRWTKAVIKLFVPILIQPELRRQFVAGVGIEARIGCSTKAWNDMSGRMNMSQWNYIPNACTICSYSTLKSM